MTNKQEGDNPQNRGMDSSATEEDRLRITERERLQALVAADLDVADRLHADDFQLITPSGLVLSKEQYLGKIASGELNYQVWEPDAPIDVRLSVTGWRSSLPVAAGHRRQRAPCGAQALLAY